MTVRYISGVFKVVGASPDGDSVRFTPTNLDAFKDAGIKVRANSTGGVQLRLDAIDALEMHYTPPHGLPAEQPAEFALGAAEALLDMIGFSNVVRDDRKYVTSATPDHTPGYILTQFADKYGRAVAMAFPGVREGEDPDGSLVYLDPTEMRRSVNLRLLEAGWVYPTFYSKLYYDLRAVLAETATAGRADGTGLWSEDATLTGFTLTSRDQLAQYLVILPKLFRRLAEYLALDETGGVDLSGFSAFLEAKTDQLYTLPAGQMTHLDTLVEVAGQSVKMTVPPEQIVFIEA